MPFPDDWKVHPDGSIGPDPTLRKAGANYEGRDFKSLPTFYAGKQYRSRAEARWALVMTVLGLSFQYEPMTFSLPIAWYLPDFLLIGQRCWVEVKGPHPSDLEKKKARQLSVLTNLPAYIFSCGIPVIGPEGTPKYECTQDDKLHGWKFDPDGVEQTGYMFGVKECCGRVAIVQGGRTDLISCDCGEAGYDPRYLYALQLAFQRGRLARWD